MISKAHLLRLLRESTGLTQETAAKKVKIAASYLSLIEHGRKEPSNDVLTKLADLYKVPAYLLVWDDKNMERTATKEERDLLKRINKFMEQLFFLVMQRHERKKRS